MAEGVVSLVVLEVHQQTLLIRFDSDLVHEIRVATTIQDHQQATSARSQISLRSSYRPNRYPGAGGSTGAPAKHCAMSIH